MWVKDKNIEVNLENFKTLDGFMAYFKQKYNIKIRKVTHKPVTDSFRSNVKKR